MPPSLRRIPASPGSPASTVLRGTPTSCRSSLTPPCVGARYCVVLVVRSVRHPSTCGDGPGPFTAARLPPSLRAEAKDLPGSCATPVLVPCSGTPAGPRARPFGTVGVAFRSQNGVGSRTLRSRGSITRPKHPLCTLRSAGCPYHHATLGSSRWSALLGGVHTRGVALRSFDVYGIVYSSQAWPGALCGLCGLCGWFWRSPLVVPRP
jgi:hypothetical protein